MLALAPHLASVGIPGLRPVVYNYACWCGCQQVRFKAIFSQPTSAKSAGTLILDFNTEYYCIAHAPHLASVGIPGLWPAFFIIMLLVRTPTSGIAVNIFAANFCEICGK
jgi:hypothetical protein